MGKTSGTDVTIKMFGRGHGFNNEPPSNPRVPNNIEHLLPKPDVGFGLYYAAGMCEDEAAYFRNMRDCGMNTFAPHATPLPGQSGTSAAENIARQINTAARVGMLDVRFPVFCYSIKPKGILEAMAMREPDLEWPELIAQVIDDPNATQMTRLTRQSMAARGRGLRVGTSGYGINFTGYSGMNPIGPLIDIWVILVGSLDSHVYHYANEHGATLGSYYPFAPSVMMDRFTFGVWAWKAKTKINLIWAYINEQPGCDFSRVQDTPNGPVNLPGMDALAEGILDYRLLKAVSEIDLHEARVWMEGVMEQTPISWWPGPPTSDRDEQANLCPNIDMDKMRAEGIKFLMEAR